MRMEETMKHTARFLAFLLVLVMMLTAVACGGTKEPAGEEITTTAAPEQEATTTTAVAETESPYDKDGYLKSDLPEDLNFGDATADIYKTLPATFMVTLGGFMTNAVYCLYQNAHNKTFADYAKGELWVNNLLFCALAGVLWYSQFFGLSLGKGFLTDSPSLLTFSWCILMALNVVFSNVWGIILKEWKGCSRKTIVVLLAGIAILIISSFLPELLK